MISGVAQVIAMNPSFRSLLFERRLVLGHRLQRAHRQHAGDRRTRGIRRPTARRKRRRTPSSGSSALTSTASMKSADS
jgi:hypothetical protein